jgi:two-component system chemotaxis sensor kinase CheA
MKIKTKLFILFLSLFVSMVLLLYYSVYTIQQLNSSIDKIVNQQYKKVELSTSVRQEVNNMARSLRSYITSDTDFLKQQDIKKMNNARDSGAKALLELEKMSTDEQSKLIINHLKSDALAYLNFQQKIFEMVKQGSVNEASILLTEDGQRYQQNLFNQVEDLVDINKILMENVMQNSSASYNRSILYLSSAAVLFFLLGGIFTFTFTRQITRGLAKVSKVMEGFSQGEVSFGTRLEVESKDEIGIVSAAFNQMAEVLELQASREKMWSKQLQENVWLHENMTGLFKSIQEIDDLKDAAKSTLLKIMPQLGASFGVIYTLAYREDDDSPWLERRASYAADEFGLVTHAPSFRLGEGLVGQCGLGKRIIDLSDVSPEYFRIQSGLGSLAPQQILLIPLLVGDVLKGVIEIASLHPFTTIQMEFLVQMSTLLAIHINKIKNKMQIEALLLQSQIVSKDLQEQSEELLRQQEELAQMNAELEEHTAALEESEHQLQNQQADLEHINDELRDQTRKLEEQNHSLELTSLTLKHKTDELTDAISYKSLFLANMSHELRTPLNSMLILAKLLADNKDQNLTAKQVEYALTVYSSGRDLLALINEILELAKLESKKVNMHVERVELQDVIGFVQRNFEPIAHQKGLQFNMHMDKNVPSAFLVDQQKLLQILQNLLSNALKFTEYGGVTFRIASNQRGKKLYLKPNQQFIEFSVRDTGIGIEKDKQHLVFEAFVQADGTTSRRYGGTGLGLSISREIAHLLGGEIKLQSTIGKGSVFTFEIPVEIDVIDLIASPKEEIAAALQEPEPSHRAPEPQPKSIPQQFEECTILLVDDDIRNVFALSSVMESYGLTVLYAENGREAIEVLEKNESINAILMDIMMPEMDGYEATRRIRSIPKYRDLPILAVTAKAMKDDRDQCIQAGASDYITKPVDINQLLSLLKVWLYV